jgi:hypothetical protein
VVARAHEFTPICCGIRVAHRFRLLCCPMMCIHVRWCDVSYEFRIKTMIGSSLPPVLCRAACIVYVMYGWFRIMVSDTYCVVVLCCFSSSCVPYVASFSRLYIFYCPFVFSNVY